MTTRCLGQVWRLIEGYTLTLTFSRLSAVSTWCGCKYPTYTSLTRNPHKPSPAPLTGPAVCGTTCRILEIPTQAPIILASRWTWSCMLTCSSLTQQDWRSHADISNNDIQRMRSKTYNGLWDQKVMAFVLVITYGDNFQFSASHLC